MMDVEILPKGKDKKHHKIIKEAAIFFLTSLLGARKIKKIKQVKIKLLDSIDYGETRGDCQESHYEDGTFDIFFKLLSKENLPDMLSTLAHEAVHAKQAVKGELIIEDQIWDWKGKKMKFQPEWYGFTTAQQYVKLPWEKDAYDLEMKLAKKFFVKYYKDNSEVPKHTK